MIQSVTFRLADSLPAQVFEMSRLSEMASSQRFRQIEARIDEGRGACLLRDPGCARYVQDALLHFDGERYRLHAWAIMPNHVHVLVEPMEGFRLGDLVRGWKAFTAVRISAHRQSAGQVWARDYFDRRIRDEIHYAAALQYIENNPVKAGLVSKASAWPFSSAAGRHRDREPSGSLFLGEGNDMESKGEPEGSRSQ